MISDYDPRHFCPPLLLCSCLLCCSGLCPASNLIIRLPLGPFYGGFIYTSVSSSTTEKVEGPFKPSSHQVVAESQPQTILFSPLLTRRRTSTL